MASFATTDMDRVLRIPELLDMIFGFLDMRSSNESLGCITVCKQWSEIALDSLWRDVNSLRRLFHVLSPLRMRIGIGGALKYDWVFTKLPDANDWRRFEKYSSRVRHLRFQAGPRSGMPHADVFNDVARTRTTLDILPNLRTLEWNLPLSLCVLFMHKGIKQFSVYLKAPPDALFQEIVSRMPNLTCLDLRGEPPVKDMEPALLDLLRGLPKLYKVVFPRFYVTSRVAETLSLSRSLETIEFQYGPEQGSGDPNDVHIFSPTLTEGAFPSLTDLSLSIRFGDAARFLDLAFAPTNITIFYLDSPLLESPSDVHAILDILAENCQLLENLTLMSLITATTSDALVAEDQITFANLRPLLRFPSLTKFELLHTYPLYISLEDVEELARKWPSLERLVLNNEPAVLRHSSLTLAALLPFARYCPKLEQLGLFMNASTSDLPPSDPLEPFQSLKVLCMGVSIISDPGLVALFLSQICPLGCGLNSGVTWEDDYSGVDEGIMESVRLRCEKWHKVQELLPLLTQLRMEERDRARMLQTEVEDLRIRTGLMMDRNKEIDEDRCVAL